MRIVMVLLTMLVGCGAGEAVVMVEEEQPAPPSVAPAPVVKPDQDRAIELVLAAWGVQRVPFDLEWVEGDRLDCNGEAWSGEYRGMRVCFYGATLLWPDRQPLVQVAWTPRSRFSTTTLAHELCHVYFGDVDHLAECSTDRRLSKSVPGQQALREAGL